MTDNQEPDATEADLAKIGSLHKWLVGILITYLPVVVILFFMRFPEWIILTGCLAWVCAGIVAAFGLSARWSQQDDHGDGRAKDGCFRPIAPTRCAPSEHRSTLECPGSRVYPAAAGWGARAREEVNSFACPWNRALMRKMRASSSTSRRARFLAPLTSSSTFSRSRNSKAER